MSFIRFFLCLLLCMPFAVSAQQCKRYNFLKSGFNFEEFKQCQALLNRCTANTSLPNNQCVKEVAKKNKVCTQLQKLADALKGTPATIKVESVGNFAIVDQVFVADGQHSYYIISPRHCLVNTKIDPRNLSPALKKEHKNTPFMISNWDKPQYGNGPKGAKSFTVLLKLTKTCLACEAVGWARIRFDFRPDGSLANTALQSFTKNKPT